MGFAALLIELNDNCRKQGYNIIDPGVMTLTEAALERYSNEALISGFCTHSRPFWDKIRGHEESFLKQNLGVVFQKLPVDLSPQIIRLLEARDSQGKRVVNQDDLDVIWLYLEALVKIGIKWLYQREPSDELEKEATKWGITL